MSHASSPPPSTLAYIIGTTIIAGLSGYFLGLAASVGVFPIPTFLRGTGLFPSTAAAPRPPKFLHARYASEPETSEEEISEDDLSGTLDHAPNWNNGEEQDRRDGLRASAQPAGQISFRGPLEECKLVLVVRTDLGMSKGKIAAQCSHATLACFKAITRAAQSSPVAAQVLRRWERLGQAKIAVQTNSEDVMLELQAKARSLGITAEVIQDAGRTQIASGSRTVLGVGPAPKSMVDQVTGGLKLL